MKPLFTSFLSLFCLSAAGAAPTDSVIDEIIVTAELMDQSVLQLSNSVSVFDAQQLEQRSAHHLEDVLNLAPNVNYASGASRGRFVQIRGIGERSEFQETVINSVGVLIDGIDFTGIATAATTLDVGQIEILRGPQGTLHGANALAGLINIVSPDPSNQFSGQIYSSVENFGGFKLGGVISGPIGERSAYRLALQQYQSDGFQEDVFLGRDDTNNIDETSFKGRFINAINERLNAELTLLYADIDNGYDAFSLDNTRQTFSDEPGVDRQKTLAGAVKLDYAISDTRRLQTVFSVADSDLTYRFDEDWSHVGICENTVCDSDLFGFDWFYSSVDDYQRDNRNISADIRLLDNGTQDNSWVVGIYLREQSIDLLRQYTLNETDFTSELDTTNLAIYGQFQKQLTNRWSATAGLRLERREADYIDNEDAIADPQETLWGGRIALEYLAESGAFYYGLISRGYKAGGFNTDQSIVGDLREFDTETMINYELGIKQTALDGRLSYQLSLFYQDRDDIQVRQSIVRAIATGETGDPCPCTFTDFTDNAASGSNFGLEFESRFHANDAVSLFASIGLLETRFDTFLSFEHVNADRENGIPFDLRGREQAHAPGYQFAIGGSWFITPNWQISGSVEGRDAFFFSDRHEERSDAYELLNMELAYQADNWSVAVYGKNLTNELVKTRGFGSFGNDPRSFFEVEPYNQFGAPRVVGLKANLHF